MDNMDPIDVRFLINSDQVKQEMSEVRRDITTGTDAIERATTKATQKMQDDWEGLSDGVRTFRQETDRATDQLGRTLPQAGQQARAQLNGLSNSISQISRELPAFTFSAQTGFLAISNNLPILVDEINRLKVANAAAAASGAASIPVWKAVRAAMFSWGTVLSLAITALTLFGPKLFEMVKNLFNTKKAIDQVKESQDAMNKAFESSAVKEAISDVSELQTMVDLAKKGLIEKETVVKKYNETMGKATSQVKSFDEAEKGVAENADAYIEATLKKAAAEAARAAAIEKLQEAYREQYEAEQELIEAEKRLEIERARGVVMSGTGLTSNISNAEQAVKNATFRLQQTEKNISEIGVVTQKIISKFAEQSVSTGQNLFDDNDPNKPKANSILDARQQLLDKIAALDAEYARKRFTKDEEEVQALRDKFAKVRELVDRFNADPKNQAKRIDISGLDQTEANATSDLIYRQETANLKKALTEQGRLYEQYNKVAADFGIQEAERRFGAELDLGKSYLDKLQEEYDKIAAIPADQQTGPQAERMAVVSEMLKKEQDQQARQYDALLKSLQDYNTKREMLVEQHELRVQKLKESGDESYIAEETRRHQEEINALDIAQIKKLGIYERFFQGVDKMSRMSAKKLINEVRESVRQLREQFPNLTAFFDDIERRLNESEQKLSDRIPQGLNDLSQALRRMAQEVGSVNQGLGQMLGLLSDSLARTSEIQRNMAGFQAAKKEGDGFGMVVSGMGAAGAIVGGILQLNAMMKAANERQLEMLRQQLNFQRELLFGEIEINELRRQRALEGAKIEGQTLNTLIAQREVLKSNLESLAQDIERIEGKFDRQFTEKEQKRLNDFRKGMDKEREELRAKLEESLYVVGEKTVNTGFLNLGRKTVQELGSLAGKSFQEIEDLFLQGRLTKAAEELFLKLRDLQERGVDIEQQLREIDAELRDIFTGGATASTIADGIIEGFRNGKRAVEDFGDDVEQILQKAILNGFKYRFLEAPLNELLDQLFQSAQSDGGLDPAEIDQFVQEYNKITGSALDALKALEQSTGINLGTPGEQRGLTGAIRRELTEATGSELAGLFRGFFDVSKRGLILNESRFALEKQHYEGLLRSITIQTAIEANTARTADKVTEAVTELKLIVKNTKPTSGRDLGIGP